MIRLLYVLLCGALAGAGTSCSRNGENVEIPPPVPTVTDSTGATVSYLALGDSYTIGQGVGADERFPLLLARGLRDSSLRVGEPRYVARTGWTTNDLMTAINAETDLARSYGVVTLLVGVNDQYQGRDTASYRTGFTALLERAIALAGDRRNRVFVLSIPDYSATPFVAPADKDRVRRAIDQFNAINRRITADYGVSYTDITPLSRNAATDPGLLASDGLHYSARAHAQWAALLAPKIAAALR
ncbi:SGNH/GDSL hydrolase family protein [Flaviaesturariibacter amylovorans]|uniref:SGNH/GDSL hydrolase family protein n=1 Tax=Flaviaesturariibacter amylovorans TaxID=1084520 RepID=A0ABP8H1G2_9BACT